MILLVRQNSTGERQSASLSAALSKKNWDSMGIIMHEVHTETCKGIIASNTRVTLVELKSTLETCHLPT